MTTTLLAALLISGVGGVIGGAVGPLLTTWRQRANWRAQKRAELQYDVLVGALRALAAKLTDSLDPAIQSSRAEHKGFVRKTELRAATWEALELHRGLVEVHFSPGTAAKFAVAADADISLDEVPNMDFRQKRHAAAQAMLDEVNLRRDP